LDELVEAIGAAVPKMDATEQRIAVQIYRLLAERGPVSSVDLAQATELDRDRVEAALNSWPGVFRDKEERVVGFWGLTSTRLDPEYRLQVDEKTRYAWCALDTLFIPHILGTAVLVEATCPVTGQAVSLMVDPEGVREVTPRGAVVSMVVPEGPFGYDVIESFCHRVLFFASKEAGAQWAADHSGTTLLSVDEAFELGRRYVEGTMGGVLRTR